MLMKPMETAAADAVRVSVGSAQKGDGQKYAANPVRQSHVITTANGCPVIALPARSTAVVAMPPAQCHFRSPVRSADCPEMKTPANPQAKKNPPESKVARSVPP